MRVIWLLVFVTCFFLVAGIALWRFTATRPPSPEVVSGTRPDSVSANGGWTEIKYENVPEGFVPTLPDMARTPPPTSIDVATGTEGALITVSTLYLRLDTPGSVSLSDFPAREQEIIAAGYAALREAVALRCLYSKGNAAEVYHFWHRQSPAAADPQRLLARHPLHPLLQVGGSRINFPATSIDAACSR